MATQQNSSPNIMAQIEKSDQEWQACLSAEAFHILRQKGTEPPFSKQSHWQEGEDLIYYCAGCGAPLFRSEAKFDSGSGWPSFFAPFAKENLMISIDYTHGMIRQEVCCSRCHGHLGHLFADGPAPTGQRYCINGVALKTEKN